MSKKVGGFIYWAPRVLSILFILFLAMFSLDVIRPGLSLIRILTGLFMHNIPVLILTAILIISWKYEIIGGIAFLLVGLLFIIRAFISQTVGYENILWRLILELPAFLIGILFLVNWFKKRRTVNDKP